MGTVVVTVMLKPEVLDGPGQALARQLAGAGYAQFIDVRQGKRFTLNVAGPVTDEVLAAARQAAQEHLADAATEEIVSVRDAQEAVDWDDMPEAWDDGAMLTAAEGMRDHGQDPRAARDHTTGRGHAVSPEVLHDLSGTGDYGVYGGGDDDER